MERGYFFVDPRTCEDILYVPRVFEVRCFEGRGGGYSVSFSKRKLERYAVADSLHVEGVMWGVKNGLVEIVKIEDDDLKKICKLCEAGDKESIGEAKEIAMNIFDMATYSLDESIDRWDEDEEWDMPIDGS